MKLSLDTKVHELISAYPFLEDFLAGLHPKFSLLRNRMARATIGRVATLRAAAGIADLDGKKLLADIAAEIERKTGTSPEPGLADQKPVLNRVERKELLKKIIRDLHAGLELEKARALFAEAVADVEASEIAAMEEELIREGLPVAEVQKLCDVHVGAFRKALDEHPEAEVPEGHPVHTYRQDNRIISKLAEELGKAASKEGKKALEEAAPILLKLSAGLENHYQRKENQLFPLLERHGVTGPSQVMWGVHDQIRKALKEAQRLVELGDREGFIKLAPALARDVVEMIYKEEKILFPLALQTLSEKEWAEARRGEDELGYLLSRPAAQWPAEGGEKTAVQAASLLQLKTGELTLEQLNLMLTRLPLDISFVDENDTVRFYSDSPDRIFPRSPAVIGRQVQKCHPPKSLDRVQQILDSFRSGRANVAEFWIQRQGRFIHIRYFALRDALGKYRGCLEVSQDVTEIRKLEGERRLASFGN
jgi:DUF438 domain-containing protein